jgi:hypothetical protein
VEKKEMERYLRINPEVKHIKDFEQYIQSNQLENKSSEEIKKFIDDLIIQLKPRELTEEEINQIIDSLNSVVYETFPEIGEQYIVSLRKKIKTLLKDIFLSPAVILQFIELMLLYFKSSIAPPGLAVGMHSVDSILQLVTQSTISAFHNAGSFKVDPLARLEQIINTSEPKRVINTIFFNNDLNRRQIQQKKLELQALKIINFVDDLEVETVEEIMSRNDYWYEIYNALFVDVDMRSTYILRIKFNESTMNYYRMKLIDISEALLNSDVSDEDGNFIKTVISPNSEYIIDVYFNDDLISSTQARKLNVETTIDSSIRTKVFIERILIPSLKQITVRGIEGITSFDIGNELISLFFLKSRKLKTDLWKIYLDKKAVIRFGLSESKLRFFFELIKLKIDSINRDSFNTISTLIINSKIDPIVVVNNQLNETNDLLTSEVFNNNSIFYGILFGGDLEEILLREDINPYISYSDNIHQIKKLFGIEAVRNFLNIDLARTIGATPGDYPVSSRHITIFSDWMTNLGQLNSMSVEKIKNFDEGYNNLATIRKPLDFYQAAAALGSYESSNTVANAVCLGRCIPLGTGNVKTLQDIVNGKDESTDPQPKHYIPNSNLNEPIIPRASSTIIRDVDPNEINFNTQVNDSLNLQSVILEDVADLLNEELVNFNSAEEFEKCSLNANPTDPVINQEFNRQDNKGFEFVNDKIGEQALNRSTRKKSQKKVKMLRMED